MSTKSKLLAMTENLQLPSEAAPRAPTVDAMPTGAAATPAPPAPSQADLLLPTGRAADLDDDEEGLSTLSSRSLTSLLSSLVPQDAADAVEMPELVALFTHI